MLRFKLNKWYKRALYEAIYLLRLNKVLEVGRVRTELSFSWEVWVRLKK